jgi:hypothetical protein
MTISTALMTKLQISNLRYKICESAVYPPSASHSGQCITDQPILIILLQRTTKHMLRGQHDLRIDLREHFRQSAVSFA